MNSGRTPDDFRQFFAEVFVALDANPKAMKVKVFGDGVTVDFADGNPVFKMAGQRAAPANYRRRWIPEHPVPLGLRKTSVFSFEPTTGNRVKVRVK